MQQGDTVLTNTVCDCYIIVHVHNQQIVLRSGVLPVVRQVGLDQNSNQGDDHNWQRETWYKWKKGEWSCTAYYSDIWNITKHINY